MPIYLNIVRHPVDRVYAWYYYIRAPWYIINPNPQDMTMKYNSLNITDNNNSTNTFNGTEWDTGIQKKQWNWKKGRMPNLRFLKTSFVDCVNNGVPECQYIKGETYNRWIKISLFLEHYYIIAVFM